MRGLFGKDGGGGGNSDGPGGGADDCCAEDDDASSSDIICCQIVRFYYSGEKITFMAGRRAFREWDIIVTVNFFFRLRRWAVGHGNVIVV